MASDSTLWYRVGYALERARSASEPSESNGEKHERRVRSSDEGADAGWPTADDLIATGVTALAAKVLDAWIPGRKVTFTRLLRAGLAGAGAALLVDLVKPLLNGRAELPELDRDTGARLLAGASQGLLYGAVIEPRVPGPPIFKGAVFALAEYMAHPAGGLVHLLRGQTPQGKLPVVRDLLGELEPAEREYVEELAFGVALAILCGSSPSLNGHAEADED